MPSRSPGRLVAIATLLVASVVAALAHAAERVAVTVQVTDELSGSGLAYSMVTNVDAGVDGLTAMRRVVSTDVDSYAGVGVFVKSIAGVAAPQDAFWALSIDGQRSPVGVSEVVVDRQMSIEWNLVRVGDE